MEYNNTIFSPSNLVRQPLSPTHAKSIHEYAIVATPKHQGWGSNYLRFDNETSHYKVRVKNWWNRSRPGETYVSLQVKQPDGSFVTYQVKVESLIRRLCMSEKVEEIVEKANQGKLEELVDTQIKNLKRIEANAQNCYNHILAKYAYEHEDGVLRAKEGNVSIGLTPKQLRRVIRRGYLLSEDSGIVEEGVHKIAVKKHQHSLKLLNVSLAESSRDSRFAHIRAVIDISGAETAIAKEPLKEGPEAEASNKYIQNEGSILAKIYSTFKQVVGIQEPLFVLNWKGQNVFFSRQYAADLAQIMRGEKMQELGPALRRYSEVQIDIIDQILAGLVILQKMEIAHLDIKPSNILVKWEEDKKHYKVGLADFGFACNIRELYLNKNGYQWAHCHGTTGYLRNTDETALRSARSYFEFRSLLHKRDVYATGLTLIQAFCALENRPVNRTQALMVLNDSCLTDGIKKLLKNMIEDDPNKRPSPRELQGRWETIKSKEESSYFSI